LTTLHIPATYEPKTVERFVRDLDRRLEPLDRGILTAEWALFTGQGTGGGSDRGQLRRTALLSDPRLLPWIERATGRSPSRFTERRLALLERLVRDTLIEQQPEIVQLRGEMQRRIVRFRPSWNGRSVGRSRIQRLLRESRDRPARRRAFYAFEPLHRPLEDGLRRLVRARNAGARSQGFRTFAEMRLRFAGVTPNQLETWSEEVAGPARAQVAELRDRFQDRTGARSWFPWDFSFARQDRVRLPPRAFPRAGMMPRILSAVRRWGFPVDRMRFRIVFHDVPAGGMTLAPHPPDDVRIVVHPTGGWLAHLVLFHEVGHAVHSASIRAPGHLLRWHENVPGFAPFHEGIGTLFEEIPSLAAWLRTLRGISPAQAEEFALAQRHEGALDAGWHAAWLRIEQRLYREPDRDPMPEAQRFERRVFGYDRYPPLSFVDPFFVDTPVYAPSYLLALLFGQQLRAGLIDRFGEPFWPNPRIGPWLTRHWMRPGSMVEWIPAMAELTGRPFGSAAFRAGVT